MGWDDRSPELGGPPIEGPAVAVPCDPSSGSGSCSGRESGAAEDISAACCTAAAAHGDASGGTRRVGNESVRRAEGSIGLGELLAGDSDDAVPEGPAKASGRCSDSESGAAEDISTACWPGGEVSGAGRLVGNESVGRWARSAGRASGPAGAAGLAGGSGVTSCGAGAFGCGGGVE